MDLLSGKLVRPAGAGPGASGQEWSGVRFAIGAAMLLVAAMVGYLPSLGGGKVWDDTFLVGENPFFRSPVFFMEVFRQWLWVDPIAAYYRPVQNWSYMLDYLVWGEWFPGYRLTSLLVHVVAGCLLWRLLRALFIETMGAGRRAREASLLAWFCAAAWLIHPAHSAAVAYVSGRADPLAAAFALSGWQLWRQAFACGTGHRSGKVLSAGAGVICLLLGLCSRETGLLWLMAFAGWEVIARWHSRRGVAMLALASAGVLTAFYAWLRTLPPDLWPKPNTPGTHEITSKLADSLFALGDYAMLFFVPFRLSMERPLVTSGWGWVGLLAAGLVLLAALTAMVFVRGRFLRLRRFFVFWFVGGFLAIAPVFAANATVAEHWMYFPYVGMMAGLCLLVWDILGLWNERWLRVGVVVLACCWMGFLVVRLHLRAKDWRDQAAFMTATLEHGERTARIEGLAAANLARAGETRKAEALLVEAIARKPGDRLLPIYLASVLEQAGRLEEALPKVTMSADELRRLRGLHPLVALAPMTKARILVKMGDRETALQILEEAADIWPGHWQLHASLAALCMEMGNRSEAIKVIAKFHERHPWHLEATMRLAAMLSQDGKPDQAAALLENARWLDVRSPEPDRLLAAVHADHKNWQEAIEAQKRAFSRSGGAAKDAEALKALARAAQEERM